MENINDLLQSELIIDGASAASLKETAMWGRFLGILGFIYSGIISVLAVFSGFFFQKLLPKATEVNQAAMIGGVFIGVLYFVMAVIIFFMSMYLFRFGNKAQAALKTSDQESLVESLKNLRLYFRFIGVITLISLICTALAIVGILVAAAFGR